MVDTQIVPVPPTRWEQSMAAQYPPSHFCDMCLSVLSTIKEYAVRHASPYTRVEDVRKSAEESKCALCYQFWRATGPGTQQSWHVRPEDWSTQCVMTPRKSMSTTSDHEGGPVYVRDDRRMPGGLIWVLYSRYVDESEMFRVSVLPTLYIRKSAR